MLSRLLSCLLLAVLAVLSLGSDSPQEAAKGSQKWPDAQAVARRALVLRAVYATRLFPRAGENVSLQVLSRLEDERFRILQWLRREELWKHASPWEKKVLETPTGEVDNQNAARIHLQGERLLVLLYALGLLEELPPYDRAANLDPSLRKKLPRIGRPAAPFLQKARLRPREDTEKAGETADFWNWRARTRELSEARRFPEGKALEESIRTIRAQLARAGLEPRPMEDGPSMIREAIRLSAYLAHKEKRIPSPIGDDFPALGKAYRELSGKDFARIRAIARERYRTFNWLNGTEKDWDQVPGDK